MREAHLPRLASAARELVVFDFDLTLTRWDTADRFFRWLLRRQWWRLAMVVVALPVLGPMLLLPRVRKCRFGTRCGLRRSAVPHRICVNASRPTRTRSSAAAKPCSWGRVCSACNSTSIKGSRGGGDWMPGGARPGVAPARGIPRRCRGGFFAQGHWGGLARHEHCFGARKISMLAARGYAAPWAITYTDHPCDLPVLKLARERFLVNQKPGAAESIERELGCRTEILAWS